MGRWVGVEGAARRLLFDEGISVCGEPDVVRGGERVGGVVGLV